MEYLVMSCNLSHAVVADEAGRFFKVPNLNYEVGQVLRDVVILSESPVRKTSAGRILRFAALAACLCLALLGGILWQKPVGTVQLHLSPGVRLRVNRFNRVVSSAGTGTEGEALLRGYHAYGQTVQKVSDGLADRAVEMGYLTEGEQITVRVESNQISWKTALENLLRTELDEHLEQRFTVVVDNDDPDTQMTMTTRTTTTRTTTTRTTTTRTTTTRTTTTRMTMNRTTTIRTTTTRMTTTRMTTTRMTMTWMTTIRTTTIRTTTIRMTMNLTTIRTAIRPGKNPEKVWC